MTYKRIRELREDHDLTQKYMAHYLNVIQRTYSRYERGERIIPPDVLCKIADFYNVSVEKQKTPSALCQVSFVFCLRLFFPV